ncbi:MAG: hypothetical protein AAF202_02390, partial [Pseudomonadota bacterium]
EKRLFPGGDVFVSDIESVKTTDLILLQCEAPSLKQTTDQQFERVYYIKACPNQDAGFVTDKLISYLSASPGAEPRIDSAKYSLMK